MNIQMNKNFQNYLLFLGVFFFVLLTFFNKPKTHNDLVKIAPLTAIKHFSVGFQSLIASSLWMTFLQNSDYCEKKTNQIECVGQSWLFQNLNLATELDPNLDSEMYRMGALALTIIISDYAGASIIFDKAVLKYPKECVLLYSDGYQAIFEEKNKVKAAELYFRAAQHGAPEWVHVMAGRLAAESGEFDYAERILQTMMDTNQDEKLILRLKEKLANLKNKTNLLNSNAKEIKKDL